MKKCFTYVANKAFSALPAKIFFLALLLCCKGFEGNATAWTTGTAGDVTILTNWTNGTTSPTGFTTPGDTWTVTLAMTQSSSSLSWVVGSPSSTAVTVTFSTGGSVTMSGAGSVFPDTVYGNVIINGGTFSLGGAGTTANTYIYGNVTFNSGTISSVASTTIFNINTYGNYSMSGGTATTSGAGSILTTNVNGNFSMTGGVFTAGGASGVVTNNIFGNCSFSGTSAMTNTGAGCTSTVHLCLPSTSGTMLIDNTSTGTWSGTNIFVDTACTAQLDGNFSVITGSISTGGSFGLTVNGTLICPAAYIINGTGIFKLNGVATLKVASNGGIDGAINNSGTKTFANSANYVYNGSVAQITGAYLPTALVAPDTITINNSAGVTLTQTTSTTGTLLFTSGILYTGAANTMSTPGTATAVVGAGLTNYVDGTLIKDITGKTSVKYEVGDLDYAPMNLTLSPAGTGGSLGVMSTNGLHPNVGTSGISPSNIVNHYWTITDYGATGPATVTPKATYNLSDILGGSNASFVTQEYAAAAWLPSALATTNTSAPYTSVPGAGISLGTLPGDYIFGIGCGSPITGTTTLCTGSITHLSDATPAGTWSSNNTGIATVSATGIVTGVTGGAATIFYNTASCSMSVIVSVGTLPVTGATTICTGSTSALSDASPGGTWSSSNTAIATVSGTGVVTGVASGSANISYTAGGCPPVGIAITVTTLGGITGVTTMCAGSATSLSDATPGGVWSSGNTAIATVSGTGVVIGASAGTTVIIYKLGTCSASATVTVSGTLAPITGSTAVCLGSTIHLSDATPGGVWSSGNTAIATVTGAGVVTGVAAGSANITYAIGSCTVSMAVTIGGPPSAITGGTTVCAGSTINLTDATPGGVWSSSNTAIATISGTGLVTGIVPGSATISYVVGGCTVSELVTVGSSISAIAGTPTTFCAGSTTTLSDATPGGTWSSGNTAIATVSGTGVVHGASAGTATISYSAGGCSVNINVTIDPPNAGTITGKDSVCLGAIHAITLSDNVSGGVWSSSNSSLATVTPATGVVTAATNGPATVTITYKVINTCGTYSVTYVVHIRSASQCATGVNPVTEAQLTGLKVFPNPNGGTFTMNLLSDVADEEVHVVITNIVGEKVKEFITTTNKSVDIKLNPAAGIYLLSASTAHGRYIAKVVVD